MILTILNQTAGTLSYLGGAVTVVANGSTTVQSQYLDSISRDPGLLNDCLQSNVQLSDGVQTYVVSQAQNYLNIISSLTVSPKPFVDNTISGTFNGAAQTLEINTVGCSSVQYGTTDSGWIGEISTELSYDNGTTWFPCATADTDPSTNLLMLIWGDALVPAFNNDPWEVNVAGSTLFRLRVVNYTAGSLSIVLISSAASSYVPTPSNDRWSSNSVGALNATVSNPTAGCSTCGIAISGTWSGTLTIQASIDNVNFFNIPVVNVATGLQTSTITANGNFITPCGGYNTVQAIMTSYSSGTADITMDAGEGSNTGLFSIDPITNYSHISGNATTTVKTGMGRLHSISINNNTTGGTVKVYDNTAGSGTLMMNILIGTPSGGLLSSSGQAGPVMMGPFGPNGLTFFIGLTIVTSGSTSNDITVIYQ